MSSRVIWQANSLGGLSEGGGFITEYFSDAATFLRVILLPVKSGMTSLIGLGASFFLLSSSLEN
jgi:hypothetical protein